MAPRKQPVLHVKSTRAKGKVYLYFRTGQTDARGKEVLTRLPDKDDPGFWNSYASCMAGRTRRENRPTELTVTALCDLWEKSAKWTQPREQGGYAPGTKKLYRIGLDYFKAKLPTAPAGLLEQQDLVRLIDERADQPGAANSILRTINSLYKWARKRGHVANDPGKNIEELDVGEHEPWPMNVLEAALASDDARVRLGAHLLYFAGQRIEDTVRMKGGDFRDTAEGLRLYVKQQKTGRELLIPMHPDLEAELARHSFGLGYIIPGSKPGQPLSQQALRDALKGFAATRGAKAVPHGLRKNAVNSLLEAGCSAAQTASITGQSLGVVEHYAKKRAQGTLATAAILKWGTSSELANSRKQG